MVKLIARFFLWLTSIALPIFIAACYGMPYGFTRSGRVIDRDTKQGINGIQVTCVSDGQAQSHTYSEQAGSIIGYYELGSESPCDELRFEDVDGAANGGLYATKSVTPTYGSPQDVELSK